MNLSEISAALQRGENLTAEQEATMIAALLGGKLAKLYVATGDAGNEELQINIAAGDPFGEGWRGFPYWPSRSLDAAFEFVAEVFPGAAISMCGDRHGWSATLHRPRGDGNAPTPPAAIMPAAIEAHLAKGGV